MNGNRRVHVGNIPEHCDTWRTLRAALENAGFIRPVHVNLILNQCGGRHAAILTFREPWHAEALLQAGSPPLFGEEEQRPVIG